MGCWSPSDHWLHFILCSSNRIRILLPFFHPCIISKKAYQNHPTASNTPNAPFSVSCHGFGTRVLISWVSTGIHFWYRCHRSRRSAAVHKSLNLLEVLGPDQVLEFSSEKRPEHKCTRTDWTNRSKHSSEGTVVWFSWMWWRKKTTFDRLGISAATVFLRWKIDFSVFILQVLPVPALVLGASLVTLDQKGTYQNLEPIPWCCMLAAHCSSGVD